MNETSLLAFWGKAQSASEEGPHYHPLPYHALDVAAVGKVWLELDPLLARWLARVLNTPAEQLVPLVSLLLAIHDIGKFAAAFQSKAPDYFPFDVFVDKKPADYAPGFRHDHEGYRFFQEHFGKCFASWGAEDRYAALPLLGAVTGHHGEPPRDQSGSRLLDVYGQQGLDAARTYCRIVFDLMGRPPSVTDERAAVRASTALAGFGIASDWLGSNQQHFPYEAPGQSLGDYWKAAQKKAQAALRSAGLIGAPSAPPVSLAQLLPGVANPMPSPLQRWASTVDLPDGPLLILLEDETGSGKTEAALLLASRLMAKGEASGVYTALPTMATANALFERLANCYSKLFEPETFPSLALVHGRSHLRAAFRALNLGSTGEGERYGAEDSASTSCSAWLSDDRRKALLADVGVGTIDQAVLSILPARFQALRAFGLARKVLILDEVHAYDAFVSQELERLIEWQAHLGGSCILLSATLPLSVRQKLVRAYRVGVDAGEVKITESGYPLATLVSRDACRLEVVTERSSRARRVPVRFLDTPATAVEFARRAAQEGQAVAYIRNTVDDAIDAHAQLRAQGVDALLFHARMALIDRFAIEGRVLSLFGKSGKTSDRAGKVLVATQVIEQSLDLDFDCMITDLAPVDLIVQRAGRLWRHARPERKGVPELHVVSPLPVADAARNWFSTVLPRAQWVYQDHARLWLTAETLQRSVTIDTPEGVRSLIEAVYGHEAEERIPDALLTSRMAADGKSAAHRGAANRQILDPQSGYVSTGPWDDDGRVSTRLQDQPQTTLRLGLFHGGRIVPYAAALAGTGHLTEAEQWTLSEVQTSGHRAAADIIAPEMQQFVGGARVRWGRFDQTKLLLLLAPDMAQGRWRGLVTDSKGCTEQVLYSSASGLVFSTG